MLNQSLRSCVFTPRQRARNRCSLSCSLPCSRSIGTGLSNANHNLPNWRNYFSNQSTATCKMTSPRSRHPQRQRFQQRYLLNWNSAFYPHWISSSMARLTWPAAFYSLWSGNRLASVNDTAAHHTSDVNRPSLRDVHKCDTALAPVYTIAYTRVVIIRRA